MLAYMNLHFIDMLLNIAEHLNKVLYNSFLSLFDTFTITRYLTEFNSYYTFYMNHLNQFINENKLY